MRRLSCHVGRGGEVPVQSSAGGAALGWLVNGTRGGWYARVRYGRGILSAWSTCSTIGAAWGLLRNHKGHLEGEKGEP